MQALSPASLAERWDCSSQTIRNMIARGDLPAFKLGGKVFRIRLADVEAFECRNGTTSAVADIASPTAAAEPVEPVVGPAAEPRRAERRKAAPRIVMRKPLAPRPKR